jgi:hypothetical protein
VASSDVVIANPAVSAVPQDYDVPAAQEIVPKVVTASLDGSGAGGPYVPTLELLSPAGQVVFRSPTSTIVAAGASADVSWFPLRVTEATPSPTTPYEAIILATSGLVLYWKLDETGGTVVADSANSYDGVYVGAPTLGVPPLADVTAVTLDGSVPQTAELNTWPNQIAGINANGQMSVECWVKSAVTPGGMFVVSDTQSAGGRYFQFGSDFFGKPRWTIFGDDASGHTLTGVTSLTDGVKHHVVGTFDGVTMNVYVDGVLDATVNPAMGGFPLAGDNHGFWVGARWAQGIGYDIAYTGTIDEVALYVLAMDAATVAAHFAAG